MIVAVAEAAGFRGIDVEILDDPGQFVDRPAEALAVLLRKLRNLRGNDAGRDRDGKGDGAHEHIRRVPPANL